MTSANISGDRARCCAGAKTYFIEPLEHRTLLSVSVTSYRNDAGSTGVNSLETQLTPANVAVATFGKLRAIPTDGQMYAQPLLVSGLNIAGQTRDVVYAATEHDSVYAIDAGTGAILWQTSFINPSAGVTTVSTTDVSSTDISPEIGITGTPTIDTSTNTLYVVALTKEIVGANTHFIYRLHALDLSTGNEKDGGPVVIGDTINNSPGQYKYIAGPSVAGTGDGNVNGKVNFNALRERQRYAATEIGGNIYIAFASYGDTGPYHGWILGYNAKTLALSAVLCTTPNGAEGGIWGGGAKIASDPQGFLYAETGNGTFDTTLDSRGMPVNGDYGNTVLKIAVDPASTAANPNINGWGLKVVDYFTPFNQAGLNSGDTDLGSGSMVILPDSAGSLAHPHLMVAGGKEGRLYLIDRDNMGHFDNTTDHVVQEIPGAVTGDLATPAYFNGSIYLVGGYSSDVGHSFGISNGAITPSSTSKTPDHFGFPGSSPVISATGTSNGIVWDIDKGTAQLRAYTAGNYADEIYTSAQAANNRDQLGSAVKWSVPTVANGLVFVGTGNALLVYGLLSQPVITPAAPTNLAATAVSTQVSLTWTRNSTNEDGDYIEESFDGTNFTQVGVSSVGSTSFLAAGLSPLTQYYFRVRAYNSVGASDYTNVASVTTGANPHGGVLDFSSGFASAASQLTFNGPHAQVLNGRLRLTDGSTGEAASVFSNTPLSDTAFNSIFDFQLTSAAGDGFTFTMQGVGPTAIGTGAGGLGYSKNPDGNFGNAIGNSVAIKFDLSNNQGEGSNSTGMYLDGALPTVPFIDLTNTPINLHSGDIINANVAYDGATLTVTLTDTATGGVARQSYTVNIAQHIGSTSAYVGFTAGTGGVSAIQDIIDWTYVPASAVIPAAPSNFTAVVNSGTQVTLTWNESPATASAFLLERSDNGGPFVQIAALPSATLSFIDTALNPGSGYVYRLRAQNAPLVSTYVLTPTIIMPTPPLTATGAHTTSVTTSAITVAWINNATNADGYRVYRRLTLTGQFVVAAILPGTATSFADSNLPAGTEVDYHIQAFNVAGYSDFTGVSTMTLAAPPTALNGTYGNSGASLSWTASPGATSYNLYRATSPGGEGIVPLQTGLLSTTYIDSSAISGNTYYYEVTAVDSSGESSTSDETQVSAGQASQWRSADIGAPGVAGSTAASTNGFTLTSAGADIWGTSDQFRYVYQPLAGDGQIVTHVNISAGVQSWAKAGVMIRQTLAAGSSQVSLLLTGAYGVHEQYRLSTGGASTDVGGNTPVVSSYWVKLMRSGNTITAFESTDGVVWSPVGTALPMAAGSVYVGLAFTSHSTTLATASFDHVAIQKGQPIPTAASNLLAISGSTGVTLTWTNNASNATTFNIDRATDPLFTQNLATFHTLSTVTNYLDATASAGTTYYYRLRASNATGDSTNSNVAVATATGQLPSGWTGADIGAPTLPGSATYDPSAKAFNLTGGGADIFGASDQFQFVYQSLAGDGTIVAHVSQPANTNPWAKAGIMIRQGLGSASNFAMLALTPGYGVRLQSRTMTSPLGVDAGGITSVVASYWLKLVRRGSIITAYTSADNITWTQAGTATLGTGPMQIGLAVSAHNLSTGTKAVFDNVAVTTP